MNLRDYETTQKVASGTGEIVDLTAPYQVKESVINILFLPSLKLVGAALVKQNVLAMKIERAKDEVMLEEEEYERVVAAVNVYSARSRSDVEFVDRIINHTPQIEN